MSAKKVVLLKKILSYFALPTQIRRYDALLQTNKGSACHYSLRLIEEHFQKQYENASPIRENIETPQRTIKINGYGTSWIESW